MSALQPVLDRMTRRTAPAMISRRDDSFFHSPFELERRRLYMNETRVTIDGETFTEATAWKR